jgi:hypothetical protein
MASNATLVWLIALFILAHLYAVKASYPTQCTAPHFITIFYFSSKEFGLYGLNEVFILAHILMPCHMSFLCCPV